MRSNGLAAARSCVADPASTRARSPKPSAAIFVRIASSAARSCSTNRQVAAPRDSASSPSAPEPANRSGDGQFVKTAESAGEHRKQRLAHPVGGRTGDIPLGCHEFASAPFARNDPHQPPLSRRRVPARRRRTLAGRAPAGAASPEPLRGALVSVAGPFRGAGDGAGPLRGAVVVASSALRGAGRADLPLRAGGRAGVRGERDGLAGAAINLLFGLLHAPARIGTPVMSERNRATGLPVSSTACPAPDSPRLNGP